MPSFSFLFFFFNDTATTEIYTLSLHDALPISSGPADPGAAMPGPLGPREADVARLVADGLTNKQIGADRKSTRLNSSHSQISYAVFCLKKKKSGRSADRITSRYPPDEEPAFAV